MSPTTSFSQPAPRDHAGSLAPLYAAAIKTLGWGFRVGAALLLGGIAVALVRQEPLQRAVDPIGEIPGQLADGHAAAFIDLAILTLMVTPVVAVVVVAIGFARLGERRNALFSLAVLGVLALSIALSLFR